MGPRSRSVGLLVQQVGDQMVAFDQVAQRLHVLSRTAAATWRHCDGRNAITDLVDLVGSELGIPADEQLIALALEQLDEARLLEQRLAPASAADRVSRRDMLRWSAAATAAIFLPTITSCGAPLGPDGAMNVPGGPQMDVALVTATTTLFPSTTTTLFPSTTTTLFPSTTTTLFPSTTTTIFPSTTTTPFPSTTTTTPFPSTTTTTLPPTTTTTTTTAAPRKVMLCHKGKSIMVDQHAVAAHLAHGDSLGPCP